MIYLRTCFIEDLFKYSIFRTVFMYCVEQIIRIYKVFRCLYYGCNSKNVFNDKLLRVVKKEEYSLFISIKDTQ